MDRHFARTALIVMGSCAACGGESPIVQPSAPGQGSPSAFAGVASAGEPPAALPIDGRLAFSSTRDGAYYVYVADGSAVRRLAPGERPRWSPDGRELTFQRNGGIHVMNADGSGQRMLAQGYAPDWSPDGTRIVYVFGGTVARNLEDGGIFTVATGGGSPTRLVGHDVVADRPGTVTTPAWSPDGRHIAFVLTNYDFPWTIYVMNADGSAVRRLSSGAFVTESEPSWSPDGSQLAFVSFDGIYVANPDGSGRRPVATGGPLGALGPDWTRSGLVFSRRTGPGPAVFGGPEWRIFSTEGGAERQIVPDANASLRYGDSYPSWVP